MIMESVAALLIAWGLVLLALSIPIAAVLMVCCCVAFAEWLGVLPRSKYVRQEDNRAVDAGPK